MRYRQYGKSAIKVSEVGLGTWQLGNHIDWSAMSGLSSILCKLYCLNIQSMSICHLPREIRIQVSE